MAQSNKDTNHRSPHSLAVEVQVEILKSLAALPCIILGCTTSECRRWNDADGVNVFSMYMPLLGRFPDNDGTHPSVRKLAYRALASVIRHNAPQTVTEEHLPVPESVMIALTSSNRSIRLAAG